MEGIACPTAEPLDQRNAIPGVKQRTRAPNAQRVSRNPLLGDTTPSGGLLDGLLNLRAEERRPIRFPEQRQLRLVAALEPLWAFLLESGQHLDNADRAPTPKMVARRTGVEDVGLGGANSQ